MKELDLGKEKINKLLLSFSIPCIISMLINSVYNIVDQIFIGQGVGTIGNAATNVIFPIVIICTAIASLIGNGCAANMSLRLGEGNKEAARKSTGSALTLLFIASISVLILGEIFLPVLIRLFGSTPNVYHSALIYGRIILLGAPFMIFYTGMSAIIRSDGSPKYSMVLLVVGAVINLILDPIFIFGFHLGVAGGAWATIIGQFISFIIAFLYLFRFQTVKVKKEDYKLDSSIGKVLGLGLSSFITQMTVLALFVVMNNLMNKYAIDSKFGADIPLSVYGVISKLNGLYVSCVLGISIGSQPIIGFNYGAKNYDRVKETLRKVILICAIIGLFFNILFQFFPSYIIAPFITKSDPNYALFMEFAIDFSKIFLMVCFLNSFEMCASIVIQSLGNVVKATLASFTRQIFLFIPLAFILTNIYGLYGALYAGLIADTLCFFVIIVVFITEYKKLKLDEETKTTYLETHNAVMGIAKTDKVITIAREYGSGGRYVGKILAKALNIPCYDKEIITLSAKKSGLDKDYIEKTEESKKSYSFNDDRIFESEVKVIKELAKNPCVIVGRCANYALRDKKNVINIFLYSDMENKINRCVKYYGISKDEAEKFIKKKNKERERNYNYYTEWKWNQLQNYDVAMNTDALGVEETAKVLENIVLKK